MLTIHTCGLPTYREWSAGLCTGRITLAIDRHRDAVFGGFHREPVTRGIGSLVVITRRA